MASPFEIPSGVRFTCSRCGDCCRTFEILLGPGEEESLESLEWKGRDATLVDSTTVVPARLSAWRGKRQLLRGNDGACVYLGEDDQCRIHRHFGADAKPLMCRLYPFGFYPVGDRVAVDVSFACQAVSQGKGEALERRFPEWTRLLGDVVSQEGKPKRHRLDKHREVAGELLWELEFYLLGFLDRRDLTLTDRARCMLQFVRVATTGDPTLPSAELLRRAMAAGIPDQIVREKSDATLDKTQRAVFYQWLFLTLNPITKEPKQGTPAERKASAKHHEDAIHRYLVGRGQPQVGGEQLDTTFEAIAALDSGILAPETVGDTSEVVAGNEIEMLSTWLRAKIVGQRFLMQEEKELPFVEATRKLLIAYPMVLWATKALAAHRGAEKPESRDLSAALRLVDKTLGRVSVTRLPRKQAKVYNFIMLETDLVEAASNDILAGV